MHWSTSRTLRSACLLVALLSAFVFSRVTAAAEDDAESSIKPPAVTVEIFVADDSFERGEEGTLVVAVTNASALALTSVTITGVEGSSFETKALAPFDVPAYGAETKNLTISALDDASFGDTTYAVEAGYTWTDPAGQAHVSSKFKSVDLKVKRKLEDEAGIVKGGASILYFFLPILLVLIAFKISWDLLVERRFPPTLPKIDLGALPVLVIVAAVTYGVLDRWDWLEYTGDLPSNQALAKMLTVTVPAGLMIPAFIALGRLGVDLGGRPWRFTGQEGTAAEVVRKALTGPFKKT